MRSPSTGATRATSSDSSLPPASASGPSASPRASHREGRDPLRRGDTQNGGLMRPPLVRRRGSLPSLPRRRGGGDLANPLGQHEAHVLVHSPQFGNVLGPTFTEELDEPFDQLLGGTGPRRDADRL